MAVKSFRYFGGKATLARRIVALLPRDDRARHYVEVCGGSGAVLCAISPPYPAETWNDVDDLLVNFFRVLREWPDALSRACQLTPYARSETTLATDAEACDPLERARRFIFQTHSAMFGRFDAGTLRLTTNAPIDPALSWDPETWQALARRLPVLAQRFKEVQIESRPAVELVGLYDSPQALFYLDPPYVPDTRSSGKAYRHDMGEAEHVALAARLHRIEGRAVVSGYDSKLYRRLYHGWRCVELADRQAAACIGNNVVPELARRRELVWCNF